MLITVIYQDNKMGLTDSSQLDELILSNKIKKFLRSEGWVTIGKSRLRRGSKHNYLGRERRQHIKI